MNRRHAAWLLLALWVLGLGWLAQRRLFSTRHATSEDVVLNVSPGAAYHRLSLSDIQLGVRSTTLDTLGPELGASELRIEEVLVLTLPVAGSAKRTSARVQAFLTRGLRLKRFETTVSGDLERFSALGEVEDDTTLRVVVLSESDSSTTRIRFAETPTLPQLVPLIVAFGGSRHLGDTATYEAFDPVLLTAQQVRVTVGPDSTFAVPDSAQWDSTGSRWIPAHWDTVTAFRLEQRRDGVGETTWVGADGMVIHATTAVGVVTEQQAFELSYENFVRPQGAQTSGSTAPLGVLYPSPTTALAADTSKAPDSLRILIRHVNPDALAALVGGRQQLIGDTLVVAPDRALASRYRLPAPPRIEPRARLAEVLIPAHDARIQAQARLVLGRERRPDRASGLLAEWVHDNVRKSTVDGRPTAADVLRTRRGDVNEHALLFVALARAAGIPARPVTGVILVDGRFYYHAWAEVFLTDWVAVDPTLGRFPADARHIRLAVDRLARPTDLINLVGRLQLRTP